MREWLESKGATVERGPCARMGGLGFTAKTIKLRPQRHHDGLTLCIQQMTNETQIVRYVLHE